MSGADQRATSAMELAKRAAVTEEDLLNNFDEYKKMIGELFEEYGISEAAGPVYRILTEADFKYTYRSYS